MKNKPKIITLLLVTIVTLARAAPAFGNAVFTLRNQPQPNEQHILFTTDQTGSTVNGFTRQTNTLVQFFSTTDTLVVASAGPAKITAADGFVNDITITVPGALFADFILNPLKPTNNNDLMIVVTMSDNSVFNFGLYGSIHGNNFLTITTSSGELIKSVTVDSVGGFGDLREPRISGIVLVSQSSSLLLLGSGLLGLGGLLRRKLKGRNGNM